ncbi:polyprenyl synthetase family protein [Streptomyces sp. NPDC058308]|uniref:polyprenyl synthetase family protein n=1 Tax=Streptomyces sp. NPDC058308 TaxID=3346440 RepID=UPI0036E6C386
MTAPISTLDALDSEIVLKSVDDALADFLAVKNSATAQPHLPYLSGLVRDFLSGGKRIRPLLCATGWRAMGGGDDDEPMIQIAACLEMFHAFALIHDDVMDNSDTRRGRSTIHRTMAAHRATSRGAEEADWFGVSAAVLLGDLTLTWSDELLHQAGLTPGQLAAVLPLLAEMRTELMLGQYLDLHATGELTADVDATLNVYRYKTAKYTIERPLHIGAAMAGAGPEAMAAFTAYALPLGEAFQLRDDLLGVYGDPLITGKSRMDDLRAGKNTALTALALSAADGEQTARLRRLLGDPLLDEEGAETVRGIFEATRARDGVERMIDDRRREALRALDRAPFTADTVNTLEQITRMAIVRDS